MFLPQSVPHHGNRLHGCLMIYILGFHRHNTVVVVYISVGVGVSNGFHLLSNLGFRVQDNVKIFSFFDFDAQFSLQGISIEPSVQDW